MPRDQDHCTGKIASIDVTLERSGQSLEPSNIEAKLLGLRNTLLLPG